VGGRRSVIVGAVCGKGVFKGSGREREWWMVRLVMIEQVSGTRRVYEGE